MFASCTFLSGTYLLSIPLAFICFVSASGHGLWYHFSRKVPNDSNSYRWIWNFSALVLQVGKVFELSCELVSLHESISFWMNNRSCLVMDSLGDLWLWSKACLEYIAYLRKSESFCGMTLRKNILAYITNLKVPKWNLENFMCPLWLWRNIQ